MPKAAGMISGVALVGVGLLMLSIWAWRIFNPNAADRARLAVIADTGGVSATAPADSKKIYLLGGIVALTAGGALVQRSRRK